MPSYRHDKPRTDELKAKGSKANSTEVCSLVQQPEKIRGYSHFAYRAQFYARNRFTEIVTHLGDTESSTLIKGQLSYTAVLAETRLEAGVYRLQAIVKLQSVPATPGSFKIPLLQVV